VYSTSEITVSGELVEGTYSGPEAVSVCDRNGRWVSSRVTHHEVMLLKDGPVVAGDGSTLVLYIAFPNPAFELDDSQFIAGQGAVDRNCNRVDISRSLNEPAFWMIQLWLYVQSENLPDPPRAWGLSDEDANEEYARLFQHRWDAGIWPFVRMPVDGSRYVEIEYAAGIEYQTRVWIGEMTAPECSWVTTVDTSRSRHFGLRRFWLWRT
jgi:hypothetical protein